MLLLPGDPGGPLGGPQEPLLCREQLRVYIGRARARHEDGLPPRNSWGPRNPGEASNAAWPKQPLGLLGSDAKAQSVRERPRNYRGGAMCASSFSMDCIMDAAASRRSPEGLGDPRGPRGKRKTPQGLQGLYRMRQRGAADARKAKQKHKKLV